MNIENTIRQFEVANSIGETMIISPRTELNRKRLYTLQNWIDDEKLQRAIIFGIASEELPISALISIEPQGIVFTLTGGNHRTGVAWSLGSKIPLTIVGFYNGQKRWGFNKIAQQVRSKLGQLD